ncbi:hypothetical protein JYK00_03395 [Thermosipho ferrireducens]|uniref:Uncharacterized protein n=1 Tax=Thermosipho ferrireducens TaxID=2571116 RepID=A0ABX7S9K4_9BACT|nr:hypothetical protein [Thermosipho ferrireducens]QTA38571.1 hypothetical protein JYK00_03395 [Thermosipho ferrireducens]
MNLKNKKSIIKTLKTVYEKINSGKLSQYWENFSPLPIAFYNDSHVYIIGLDKPPENFEEEQGVFVGPWNERFVGNTAINYNGKYIGIWDLSTVEEFETFAFFYSKIVHEIFHGFQFLNNDKRFANEFLAFQYPYTPENISLRILERKYLLKAVFENNKKLKMENLQKFVIYREKRRELIGSFLDYELGLESMEGTAMYVEYRGLLDESNLPKDFIIALFGQNLAKVKDLSNFRASCYSSGMYISLILDYITPDWKTNYTTSQKYLYNFLLDNINFPIKHKDLHVDEQTKELAQRLIEKYRNSINKAFETFEKNSGHKIILEGNFNLAGFDPMNIIKQGNKLLHKNFLKVKLKGKELFIKGPVMSELENEIWQYKKIIFFSNKKPEITSEKNIMIEELGNIQGNLIKTKNEVIIKLNT